MTTLETVEYVDTFRKLKLKHDQEKDRQENNPETSTAYVFTLSLSLHHLLFPPDPSNQQNQRCMLISNSSVLFIANKLGDPLRKHIHNVESRLLHVHTHLHTFSLTHTYTLLVTVRLAFSTLILTRVADSGVTLGSWTKTRRRGLTTKRKRRTGSSLLHQ